MILIGLVEDALFHSALAGIQSVGSRLTSIGVPEARPPESGEIDLREYEGSAIAVEGVPQGGWIFSAEIVDKGGPLITALIRRVFSGDTT
jgi:hypothetical protein